MTEKRVHNLEIDMSTLSNVQKTMCVKLLAESNVKFEELENRFVAQIRIDPAKLQQTNLLNVKNKNSAKKQQFYLNGKKYLSRTVKIGKLTNLQALHNKVQVYIYPKRISFGNLAKSLQTIYERFWLQQSSKKKSLNLKELSFCEWVYKNYILQHDKNKVQQTLANFIDSLNHYAVKSKGVRLFYRFLSQELPCDALCYFLVLRGLLEQVLDEKIVQKANNFSRTQQYLLKMNPYDKAICEESLIDFLNIFYSHNISCSKKKTKTYNMLFKSLTFKMYYDESKRKNFINYFDLVEHLVEEFIEVEPECQTKKSVNDLTLTELLSSNDKNSNNHQPSSNSQRQPSEPVCLNYQIQLSGIQHQTSHIHSDLELDISSSIKEQLISQTTKSLQAIYNKFGAKPSKTTNNKINTLLHAITEFDKTLLVEGLGITIKDKQLLYVEMLQQLYSQRRTSGVLVNDLVRRILMAPSIRESIADELILQ